MSKQNILTTSLISEGTELAIDTADVVVVEGPDQGTRVTLGGNSVTIGSSSSADLVLHDSTVSSRHAEIEFQRKGYCISDRGSKNGLLLGGWRIDRAWLTDGIKIGIGSTTIAIEAHKEQSVLKLHPAGIYGDLVAHSLRMRALMAMIERLASAEATVLIEGETGCGKDVVANTIHSRSDRKDGPLVVFDCGAVPPELAASELFGHEAGAFSGAATRRDGLFAAASGGTLFLDEVGELPRELQPLLLRALETKRTKRVGGNREQSHDLRLIAATNRNLSEEVRAGRFRSDLYHRLAVARLRVPALRERPEDIPILARIFAAGLGTTVSPELAALLGAYRWPGNVRELRNAVERSMVETLGPQPSLPQLSLPDARRQAIDRFESAYVERLLASTGGNLSRAAELAGVSRQLLTRLAAKHGLRGKRSGKKDAE